MKKRKLFQLQKKKLFFTVHGDERRKLFFSMYVHVELIIFYFVFVLVLSCLVKFYLFLCCIIVPFLYYLFIYNKLFVTNIDIYKMSIPFRESPIVEDIVVWITLLFEFCYFVFWLFCLVVFTSINCKNVYSSSKPVNIQNTFYYLFYYVLLFCLHENTV